MKNTCFIIDLAGFLVTLWQCYDSYNFRLKNFFRLIYMTYIKINIFKLSIARFSLRWHIRADLCRIFGNYSDISLFPFHLGTIWNYTDFLE